MDVEISEFIDGVGAKEPKPGDKNFLLFKSIFKRSNYFMLNGKFLITKISRSKKPFFGVGKVYIDLLNDTDNYLLVLLVSGTEGWVYSKNEINSNIQNSLWKLQEKDKNYKINFNTLRDKNSFTSHTQFLSKI